MDDAARQRFEELMEQLNGEARIRELTQERNDLLVKLGAANKELYGAKKQTTAAQISDLNDQVKTLRARLSVDESLAVAYTPEELALFKQPAPQPVNPGTEKKSIQELPAGSGQLVAEAQRFFAAKQYDKAEDNYQKILQRDENNSIVLGNLAAIEMEQGKLDEAEKHLATAVAQNPDDAYNLSMLGYLKFRQEKYDDALDALHLERAGLALEQVIFECRVINLVAGVYTALVVVMPARPAP